MLEVDYACKEAIWRGTRAISDDDSTGFGVSGSGSIGGNAKSEKQIGADNADRTWSNPVSEGSDRGGIVRELIELVDLELDELATLKASIEASTKRLKAIKSQLKNLKPE